MTLQLLDLIDPRIDQYKRQLSQFDLRQKELDQLEEDLNQREEDLNSVDPKVWQKIEKAIKKDEKKQQKKAPRIEHLLGAQNTTVSVVVNTADIAPFHETDETSISSFGSIFMIMGALILCATSAVFYKKHQR